MPSPPDDEGIMFLGCPVIPFVRSDLVTMISHEQWNNFDKTDREYSLASTDDLIRFWRSKV